MKFIGVVSCLVCLLLIANVNGFHKKKQREEAKRAKQAAKAAAKEAAKALVLAEQSEGEELPLSAEIEIINEMAEVVDDTINYMQGDQGEPGLSGGTGLPGMDGRPVSTFSLL